MKFRIICKSLLIASFMLGCSDSSFHRAEQKNENRAAGSARLQLGLEYLAQGELNAARENIEKALKADSRNYQAELAMALYEQRVGENAAAQRRYQRLVNLMPHNRTLLNHYGAFLCGLGQYSKAQQYFSAAAVTPKREAEYEQEHEQIADSLENSAYCFIKENNYKNVPLLLKRTLQYDPGKGSRLLMEIEKRLVTDRSDEAQLLLDVYQQTLPPNADSLLLQIRFAALMNQQKKLHHYARQLALNFPHSRQYQRFLANEY